jgi:hypothetical protein
MEWRTGNLFPPDMSSRELIFLICGNYKSIVTLQLQRDQAITELRPPEISREKLKPVIKRFSRARSAKIYLHQ